jgi:hypothetical protein
MIQSQPLHPIILKVFLRAVHNQREVIFMDDFICLEIEGPMSGAVEQGNIGLLSEQVTPLVQIWIPLTLYNFDLRIPNGSD